MRGSRPASSRMSASHSRMRWCAGRCSEAFHCSRPSPSMLTTAATFSGTVPAYCRAMLPPSECATIVTGARPMSSMMACRSSEKSMIE